MDIKKWLQEISNDEGYTVIARKAGLNPGTFKRQWEPGKIPPESLVAIARAYSVSPVRALIVAGLITEKEAGAAGLPALAEALRSASDAELIGELLRRVKNGSSLSNPQLFAPLDFTHESMSD